MQHRHMLVVVVTASAIAALAGGAGAQTVWDGPSIVFTKADFADPTLPANQDRITDNVWLTRGIVGGVYNAAVADSYTFDSPLDTEWAYGSAADYESLTFSTWFDWHGGNPPSTIGQDAVVHLISEDIYLDITFLEWTCCAGGGGFSYQRSTPGGCFTVTDESIQCNAGGTGFDYTVSGIDSCSGHENTYTFTGAGGAVGQEVCFTLMVTDGGGGLCCTTQQCAVIPDCTGAATSCDLDGDDVMDTGDLVILLDEWGLTGPSPADLNDDGTVGGADLLVMLSLWGPC